MDEQFEETFLTDDQPGTFTVDSLASLAGGPNDLAGGDKHSLAQAAPFCSQSSGEHNAEKLTEIQIGP